IVGAILTQNTSWKNVEKALESLSSHGLLSARAMARVPAHELAPLIRTSGYYNQKARKLTAFLKWFVKHNYSTAALRKRYAPDPLLLRAELLGLFGIGPETADSILNYALGFPFFVVDAYTHRLVERYGPHRSRQKYEIVRADVESEFTAVYGTKQLPQHLGEFHALIVRHGNSVCVKRAPRCGSCSLAGSCAFPV
ncbi:MAG: hypothetical protein HY042_05055, partial [Spirochaetia bacterium]|nr:hypothetical protein [Spirochaetia bacterium]